MIAMKQRNPFHISGPVPPEEFIGRRSLIYTVFDIIYNHQHLAVYGSKGMGKSSLLEKIASPQTWLANGCDPSQALIVSLNCAEFELPLSFTQFWEKILKKLKPLTAGNTDIDNTIDLLLSQEKLFNSDIRRILTHIGKLNHILLLLLDEFDYLVYPRETFSEEQVLDLLSQMRNLASHGEARHYYSTIVATTKRITAIGPSRPPGTSPWDNHYAVRELQPFTDEEINLLLSSLPTIWIEDLQKGVLEIAGRNPALLQNACFLLYNVWRDGGIQNLEQFGKSFETATRHFFQYAWHECTDLEKSLLKFIALSRLNGRLNQKRQYNLQGIDIILSQNDLELRLLENRGLIRRETILTKKQRGWKGVAQPLVIEKEEEVYIFDSSIMEWWIIKQMESSSNAEELEQDLEQREKILLGLSKGQVNQLKHVVHKIWQHKDLATSLVGWAGELSGAFSKGFIGSGN